MKRKYILIKLTILIILLLSIFLYKGFKHYQKIETFSAINTQLEKKGLSKDILTKQEDYDSKRGVYYYSIVYKKEKKITYITQLKNNPAPSNIIGFKNKKHAIYSYPVDNQGNEIQKNTKYKIN